MTEFSDLSSLEAEIDKLLKGTGMATVQGILGLLYFLCTKTADFFTL